MKMRERHTHTERESSRKICIRILGNNFFLKLGLRNNHGAQTVLDDVLGLLNYPVAQDVASGDILDQTDDLTSSPDTVVWVTVLVHELSTLARDQGGNLGELCSTGLALNSNDLLSDLVAEDACRVVECAEDQCSIALGSIHHRFLDVVVNGRLLGAEETSSHVDTLLKRDRTQTKSVSTAILGIEHGGGV